MDLLTIFIFIVSKYFYINAFRTFNVNGKEITFAVKNESMDIECKNDSSIAYCRFTDPSGKRYPHAGSGLRNSSCKLAIRVTKEDEGIWQCHIGSNDIGVENVKNILVKVGEKVAAVQKNISAIHGTSVTLECATIESSKPIKYCRFEPPYNAIGAMSFGINSDVNTTNLLMNRYYYPSNKSLDRGDCAVIIHGVSYADYGLWTCGAGLDDGKEYIDYIQLDVSGIYTVKTASAIAIFFAVIIMAVFMCFLACLRLDWPIMGRIQLRASEHELQPIRQGWLTRREQEQIAE